MPTVNLIDTSVSITKERSYRTNSSHETQNTDDDDSSSLLKNFLRENLSNKIFYFTRGMHPQKMPIRGKFSRKFMFFLCYIFFFDRLLLLLLFNIRRT